MLSKVGVPCSLCVATIDVATTDVESIPRVCGGKLNRTSVNAFIAS